MKRRAFTFIEISVVILILVIFAALVLPEVALQSQRQAERSFLPSLSSLISFAREESIAKGTPLILQYGSSSTDSSSNQFTVSVNTNVDPNNPQAPQSSGSSTTASTPPSSTSGSTSYNIQLFTNPNSSSNNSSPTPPNISKAVAIPLNWQASQFAVSTGSVDGSSWVLSFYPDGTSDTGSVTFTYGSAQSTVLINAQGETQIVDGAAPDPVTISWPGGSLEQRQ